MFCKVHLSLEQHYCEEKFSEQKYYVWWFLFFCLLFGRSLPYFLRLSFSHLRISFNIGNEGRVLFRKHKFSCYAFFVVTMRKKNIIKIPIQREKHDKRLLYIRSRYYFQKITMYLYLLYIYRVIPECLLSYFHIFFVDLSR